MKASKILTRSLCLFSRRAKTCECQAKSLTRTPINLSLRQHASTERTLSTSARRRQPPPETQTNLSSSNSIPPISTTKQELENYINSLQSIVDGYKLESRLPARQYESLYVSHANAEARLNAPDAHPDSFAPLLASLQGEVEPILTMNLGSSNLSQLIADVGKQKETTPPAKTKPSSTVSRSSAPPNVQTLQKSIAKKLDALTGPLPKGTRAPPPSSRVDEGESPSELASSMFDTLRSRGPSPSSSTSPLEDPDAGGSTSPETAARRTESLGIQSKLHATFLRRKDSQYLQSRRSSSRQSDKPILRLKPSLGRTVEISGGFDVTRALRSLEGLCARNNLRGDMMAQKFHVRRGQRKKIARRVNWRKTFARGFLEECARIRRMKKQGW